MSGTFPNNRIRAMNFKNNQPNLITTSLSGRRQAKSQGQQFFSFTVQTPPLVTVEYKEIMAFLASQRGQFDAFSIQLPGVSTPSGTISSDPFTVSDANADAGEKSVTVTGGVASQTDYMKAGDLVRFTDHNKVYMLTADVDTDGSGNATLNFEPGLVQDVNNGQAVETNGVQFTVFMTSGMQEYQFFVDGKTQLEFECREAI